MEWLVFMQSTNNWYMYNIIFLLTLQTIIKNNNSSPPAVPLTAVRRTEIGISIEEESADTHTVIFMLVSITTDES